MLALDCVHPSAASCTASRSCASAFMESSCGWLPFWLERLDEHWELMPEQAPNIDRKPSEYFLTATASSLRAGRADDPQVVEAAAATSSIVYASDYYHWDCAFPDTVKMVAERNDICRRRPRSASSPTTPRSCTICNEGPRRPRPRGKAAWGPVVPRGATRPLAPRGKAARGPTPRAPFGRPRAARADAAARGAGWRRASRSTSGGIGTGDGERRRRDCAA